MVWPLGSVKVNAQPFTAVELVLAMVTSAVKPPGQLFGVYVTRHGPPPPPPDWVVTLTVLELPDVLPAASRALTKKLYAVDADRPVTLNDVAVAVPIWLN